MATIGSLSNLERRRIPTDRDYWTAVAHLQRRMAAGGRVRRMRVGGSMGAGADGGDSNDRVGRDAASHNSGGGGKSNGSGGGGGSVSSGGPGTYNGQGRPNASPVATSAADAGGGGAGRGYGGFYSPTGQLKDRLDVQQQNPNVTEDQADDAARAWADRVSDYRDTYNTGLETIGNMIASGLGFDEIDPTKNFNVNNTNTDADWGFDPVQTAMSIAGTITGLPLGTTYKTITALTGHPYQANLGPSVFGSAPSGDTLTGGFRGGGPDIGGWDSGSGGSPASLGKQNGAGGGTIGGLSPLGVASMPTAPSGAAPADDDTDNSSDNQDDAATTPPPALALYPGDPLHYGEIIGGWNFWPNGHPVAAADGGAISGPGSGQDDKIPALLSNDEYVWSAQDVADLGDGSSSEGHRRLDKMRQMVRQRAGRKNTKTIAKPMASIGSLLQRSAA